MKYIKIFWSRVLTERRIFDALGWGNALWRRPNDIVTFLTLCMGRRTNSLRNLRETSNGFWGSFSNKKQMMKREDFFAQSPCSRLSPKSQVFFNSFIAWTNLLYMPASVYCFLDFSWIFFLISLCTIHFLFFILNALFCFFNESAHLIYRRYQGCFPVSKV